MCLFARVRVHARWRETGEFFFSVPVITGGGGNGQLLYGRTIIIIVCVSGLPMYRVTDLCTHYLIHIVILILENLRENIIM